MTHSVVASQRAGEAASSESEGRLSRASLGNVRGSSCLCVCECARTPGVGSRASQAEGATCVLLSGRQAAGTSRTDGRPV